MKYDEFVQSTETGIGFNSLVLKRHSLGNKALTYSDNFKQIYF